MTVEVGFREGTNPPRRDKEQIQKLTKLKRDLAKVIHENDVDKMLETKDRVVAEFLVRVIMGLTKYTDDLQQWNEVGKNED